ncbi:recombinase family protein [Bradyrhizobium iriomotense]|uniref:recombinase family protein n=1 Tax=Bradyrhizobium iriomotense TaxID=441950 RepID=UPI001FF060C0|nr:recombinase family protein [Bradyrhizobium iriomotense]
MLPRPQRAAQYVRMSTDHQQYSTANQADVIAAYARDRNIDIVRTYSDEGLSGLGINWRIGLKSLIADVEKGQADFECVLVYDVSRWGRFQDVDESAYYEFICKRAGITVHYCADEFENDGSLTSVILKNVKRVGAADYSRQLSKKVFLGQSRIVQLGFWRGGMPGYGLRRQLHDATGAVRTILEQGERKYLQTDRVKIIHGPEQEVETVRRIFKAFVSEGKYLGEIAGELNASQVRTGAGLRWDGTSIRKILVNETYTGSLIFNRTSYKLQQKRVENPSSMWIRHDQAFPPVVTQKTFAKAQEMMRVRREKMSDREAIARLTALGREKGQLSVAIMASADGILSAETYRRRFGSLVAAFELAGYQPELHRRRMLTATQYRARLKQLAAELVDRINDLGGRAMLDPTCKGIKVNDECRIALGSARAQNSARGQVRWRVHANRNVQAELTLIARMDASNAEIRNYYLLPTADLSLPSLKILRMSNSVFARACRYDSLEAFCRMCAGERQ